jgi:hypothetical protein
MVKRKKDNHWINMAKTNKNAKADTFQKRSNRGLGLNFIVSGVFIITVVVLSLIVDFPYENKELLIRIFGLLCGVYSIYAGRRYYRAGKK